MLLIGESDQKAGDTLVGIYDGLCETKPSIQRMSFVNAELTKLAVNTFVTTKISYANMLARVCERLPGADADVVTRALGCDSRIGNKYLRGALGYGGPCFPRDNVAFNRLAESLEVRAILAEATDRFNRLQAELLADRVLDLLPPGGTVGVLGLSYKPDTNVTEESQAISLCRILADKGIPVTAWDPAAIENARAALDGMVSFAESAKACAQQADLLVLTTAWPQFAQLRPADLKKGGRRPTIVDCWRVLPRAEFEKVADYVVLGLGPASPNLSPAT
jgi:UDPglucose 6-dehydrogenase